MIRKQIVDTLFAKRDLEYKAFHEKLIPNVHPDTVIGVRTPELRAYAKIIYKEPDIEIFLQTLPHKYYEENNLHAFMIEQIKNYKECICELDRFLPYVDNWATCDMMRPKCFKKHKKELLPEIERWLDSSDVYAVRFGIEMLMVHFLDESFEERFPDWVAGIIGDEYYINMMIAWYFATALAKQYDCAVRYLEKQKLPVWIHNKTIQKAVESYRITDEQKAYLRTLRRKGD